MVKYIYIHLTKGQRTKIDLKDYVRVKQYQWVARKYKGKYYACVRVKNEFGKMEWLELSHFIINFDKSKLKQGLCVDHKNRDPLDNTSKNLRIVTIKINNLNRSPNENSKTGVNGISELKNYGYLVHWTENNEGKEEYFSWKRKNQILVFWEAYDFYWDTISNIPEYREAFCLDEPEESYGSSIDEDDYENKINPRLKNRNKLDSNSGENRIQLVDRTLRVRIMINGERISQCFNFDKNYKGDLLDQKHPLWQEALNFVNEMLEEQSKFKKNKKKKNKIGFKEKIYESSYQTNDIVNQKEENSIYSEISIGNNNNESGECSFGCKKQHTILDLLNNNNNSKIEKSNESGECSIVCKKQHTISDLLNNIYCECLTFEKSNESDEMSIDCESNHTIMDLIDDCHKKDEYRKNKK